MLPIGPGHSFPAVPRAVAVGKTKGKINDVQHSQRQTRELSELLESMTQGCHQDKTEHTHPRSV